MHNIFQSDAVKLLVAQVSTQEAFVAYMSLGLDHWYLYDMLGICDMGMLKHYKNTQNFLSDPLRFHWESLTDFARGTVTRSKPTGAGLRGFMIF